MATVDMTRAISTLNDNLTNLRLDPDVPLPQMVGHVLRPPEQSGSASTIKEEIMKQWMCMNCGWVYDQALGDPIGDIPPGTAWDDIPDDWKCPDCGSLKVEFEMVEI